MDRTSSPGTGTPHAVAFCDRIRSSFQTIDRAIFRGLNPPRHATFRASHSYKGMEKFDADLDQHIFPVRGLRVMLDEDLARIYGVSTKRLNEQVRRNRQRFPAGFLIELTPAEAELMRSLFVTASRRNIRHLPLAFTEHGAIMLASVLNTAVAVEASVRVVRAFVKLRELLSSQAQLQKKMDELELRVGTHDGHIGELFDAIRQLITPASRPRRNIGFKPN